MTAINADTQVEWSTRLAQALVQGGYETESNLAPLLAEARADGQTLAEILIGRNLALPGVVVGALAHLAQLPAIDLTAVTESPDAAAAMPEDVRLEFKAVPLQFEGNVLVVASPNLRRLTKSTSWRLGSDTASIRYWPIRC